MPAASPLRLPWGMDMSFLLINKILVLGVVLLFFTGVWAVARARCRTAPPRVAATIRLALFGYLLLAGELALRDPYAAFLADLQECLVLICLANLVIYLVVDLYFQMRWRKEAPTLFRDLVNLAVYLFFGAVTLRLVFHVEISSIVTTTTIITAAIAFALQNSLSNALSGLSVQNDHRLARHTWIAIRDRNLVGRILNVGFRYTTLRTLDDTELLVPNALLVQHVVTSFGRGEERPRFSLPVSLGYEVPPERARELLLRVLAEEPRILAEPAPQVQVAAFAESAVEYALRFHLHSLQDEKPVADALLSRIWYAVNREGWHFPSPQRHVVVARPSAPAAPEQGEVVRSLEGSDLFTVLSAEERGVLAAGARLQVFGPGERVVRRREKGRSLFVVLRGEVEVSVEGTVVGRLGRQAIFGEMSLLTGEPRSADVAAIAETAVAELPCEALEPLLRARPQLAESLSAILAERELRNREKEKEAGAAAVPPTEDYLARLRRFFRL